MDPLTLSAWTCFLSSLQSAVVAFLLLPDRSAWKVHSLFELSCYIFAVSTHTHTRTHTHRDSFRNSKQNLMGLG